MRPIYPLLLFLLLCPALAAAAVLHPFTSDGCSLFPEGTWTQQNLWLDCCIAHDRTYWLGGSYLERLEADQALQQCVAAIGEPQIGTLMLAGVRVGGTPFLPTGFRWGYGWDGFRGYRPLSPQDRLLAAELLRQDPQEQPATTALPLQQQSPP